MQRGFVLPWILFLIFAIIVSGGIYYYFNSITSRVEIKQESVKVSPRAASSPQPQSITDDLLDLKLEIPVGYRKVSETEKEYFIRANGEIRKNFGSYIQYPPAEMVEGFYILSDSEKNLDQANLSIWVFKNPDNLDPQKFYSKYWYYPFVWGDFSAGKNKIAPEKKEILGGKEGESGIVDFREGKPKFIYILLKDKNLMMQIQLPSVGNEAGNKILNSFKFE